MLCDDRRTGASAISHLRRLYRPGTAGFLLRSGLVMIYALRKAAHPVFSNKQKHDELALAPGFMRGRLRCRLLRHASGGYPAPGYIAA